MVRPRMRFTLCLALALCLARSGTAYPSDFMAIYATSCTDRPSQGYGNHASPVQDSQLTFIPSLNGVAQTTLCPGQTYSIVSAFTSGAGAYLFSASQGSLATGSRSCPNRISTDVVAGGFTTSLKLACTATGSVVLSLTTATGQFSQYRQNQLTLPINTGCGCAPPPAASPPPPPTSPPPAASPPPPSPYPPPPTSPPPPTPSSPPPPPVNISIPILPPPPSPPPSPPSPSPPPPRPPPSPPHPPAPPTPGPPAPPPSPPPVVLPPFSPALDLYPGDTRGSGGALAGSATAATAQISLAGCLTSSLGYRCARALDGHRSNATLHYTVGGLAPPANLCTGPGNVSWFQDPPGSALALNVSGQTLVHWALETSLQGYVALGWTTKEGVMVPLDTAIGIIGQNGLPSLRTYHLDQYDISAPDIAASSWALAGGVVRTSRGVTICFSTAAPTGNSSGGSGTGRHLAQLDQGVTSAANQVMAMNWAAHSSSSLVTHDSEGSITLNLVTGEFRNISVGYRAWMIVHGILMIAAFILLLPTGVLLARHRVLYLQYQWGPKAVWFWLHVSCQLLGVASFLASVIIALVVFPSDNVASNVHSLWKSHEVIGIALIPLMLVQVVLAVAARPEPNAPRRALWNAVHHNWGRVTALLGVANVLIGIVMYVKGWVATNLTKQQYLLWLVPVAAFLLLLLIAEAVLSAMAVARRGKPGKEAADTNGGPHPPGDQGPNGAHTGVLYAGPPNGFHGKEAMDYMGGHTNGAGYTNGKGAGAAFGNGNGFHAVSGYGAAAPYGTAVPGHGPSALAFGLLPPPPLYLNGAAPAYHHGVAAPYSSYQATPALAGQYARDAAGAAAAAAPSAGTMTSPRAAPQAAPPAPAAASSANNRASPSVTHTGSQPAGGASQGPQAPPAAAMQGMQAPQAMYSAGPAAAVVAAGAYARPPGVPAYGHSADVIQIGRFPGQARAAAPAGLAAPRALPGLTQGTTLPQQQVAPQAQGAPLLAQQMQWAGAASQAAAYGQRGSQQQQQRAAGQSGGIGRYMRVSDELRGQAAAQWRGGLPLAAPGYAPPTPLPVPGVH